MLRQERIARGSTDRGLWCVESSLASYLAAEEKVKVSLLRESGLG